MAESWYRLPHGARPWQPDERRARARADRPAGGAAGQDAVEVRDAFSPSRVILALSPGAATEPPVQAALALAERFAVSLHVVRLGAERAEQIARLPFTREFSTTVCAFRRFEPSDARLGHLGQSRRFEIMVTRLQTERSSVAVRFEQGPVPGDPSAWVLRDSAPWMPALSSGGAYDQVIVLTDGDLAAVEAAALLPRRRSTRIRVLLAGTPDVRLDPAPLLRAVRSVGAWGLERVGPLPTAAGPSVAGREERTDATAGTDTLPEGESTGPRAETVAESRILDVCGVLNSIVVVRSALLARLGLPAERLSSRVGLAVLVLP